MRTFAKSSLRPGPIGTAALLFAGLNLALLAFGGSGPARPGTDGLDRDAFVWRAKIAALEAGRLRATRTLVLGDSLAMSAVLPAELAAGLSAAGLDAGDETSVYNLALPAQQPEGLLALLDGADFPRLERVIVNFSPFAFFETEIFAGFRTYARGELWPRRPAALLRFAYLLESPAGAADQLARLLPLYELRPAAALFALSEAEDPFAQLRLRRAEQERIASLLERDRGFWTWNRVAAARPACPGPTPAARTFPGRREYRERSGALRAWPLLLEELRSRSRVYVIQVPLSQTWRNSVAAERVYGRLDKALNDWSRRIPEPVILPRPAQTAYAGGDFVDWTHLSYCGARRYTAWLARAIVAHESN